MTHYSDLTDEDFEAARQEMARLQDAKAERRAAQPAINRFLQDRWVDLRHSFPTVFELASLFRPVSGRGLADPLVADWNDTCTREWASFTRDQRLWAWNDYLADVKRGAEGANDYHHLCQPIFNRMVRFPVIGQMLMHDQAFMAWRLGAERRP